MPRAAAWLAAIPAVAVLAAALFAAPVGARPRVTPMGQLAGQLNGAAAKVDGSLSEVKALSARSGRSPAEVQAAGVRLAQAALEARDVLGRYRDARLRDGTLGEFVSLRTLQQNLIEAVAVFSSLAGAPPPRPPAAQRRAARRQADDFEPLVRDLVAEKLGLEGLNPQVLKRITLRRITRNAVARAEEEVEDAIEARLRRLTGVGIALGVPLREQIALAGEAAVGRLFTRLVVRAGPAGIAIQLLLGRKIEQIVRLVGERLREALRRKGDLVARTRRSVAGLERLRTRFEALPENTPVEQMRKLLRDTVEAIEATGFLDGDLRRRGRTALLDQLRTARSALEQLVNSYGSVLRSEPFAVDVAAAAALAERARAEVERLGGGLSGAGAPATAGVCVPKTFSLERLDSFGNPVGGQDEVEFKELRPRRDAAGAEDQFESHCIWTFKGSTSEAFLAVVDRVPPGTPGRVASGNCSQSPTASPFASKTRYLTISGGSRSVGHRAPGGDGTILAQVLAAAEGAGVGRPCR